jgi:hypothetical protein
VHASHFSYGVEPASQPASQPASHSLTARPQAKVLFQPLPWRVLTGFFEDLPGISSRCRSLSFSPCLVDASFCAPFAAKQGRGAIPFSSVWMLP